MPFYFNLHRFDKTFTAAHAQRTADGRCLMVRKPLRRTVYR